MAGALRVPSPPSHNSRSSPGLWLSAAVSLRGWERGAGGSQPSLGWAGARCLPRGRWTLGVLKVLVGLEEFPWWSRLVPALQGQDPSHPSAAGEPAPGRAPAQPAAGADETSDINWSPLLRRWQQARDAAMQGRGDPAAGSGPCAAIPLPEPRCCGRGARPRHGAVAGARAANRNVLLCRLLRN